LILRLTAVARNERRAVERKIPLPLSVGAKPDQERNGINGGDPELVEGEEAVYAGFDLEQASLRRSPRGRVIAVPAGGHIL
jgi:hypothetical protein